MPIWTYTPLWDHVRAFFEKFAPILPPDYTGLVGIRLHRTGNPLALEVFGKKLPEDTPLPPMLLIELVKGRMKSDWARLENDFDIPWQKPEDFHAYRTDVMAYYHAEDLLEPVAEEIVKEENPSSELLRRGAFDHARVLPPMPPPKPAEAAAEGAEQPTEAGEPAEAAAS